MNIRLIIATDVQIHENYLVKAVDTVHYVLMHYDIHIMKKTCIENRLFLMKDDNDNAIAGSVAKNYGYAENCRSSFFPPGMPDKTAASR